MGLFKTLYPAAVDASKVGHYPLRVNSGGGYFYDSVLEYRVWVHAPNADAQCYSFSAYSEALRFSRKTAGAEEPLVLVLQEECIDEPEPGHFIHNKNPRLTEWRVEWLHNTQGTKQRIPEFLAQHNSQ